MSGLREEYSTALWRGLAAAFLAGALGFFGQWSQTDEVRSLVSAGVVPFLTALVSFVGYGAYDARRNDAKGGGQQQPEPQPAG